MALTTIAPAAGAATKAPPEAKYRHRRKKKPPPPSAAPAQPPPAKHAPPPPPAPTSSWGQLKNLLSCRTAASAARVHDPSAAAGGAARGLRSVACGGSLCALRDVAAAANARVVGHRGADVDGASSVASTAVISQSERDTAPLARAPRRSSNHHGATAGYPPALRGFSGCYECRAVSVEPMSRRYPRPRELCRCPECGEVFTKAESLEHHQAVRHAVSELGPEDSGRNIVEIIFKSSWIKRDLRPAVAIDRILKVHNPPRTIARFEAYRDAVRSRARSAAAAAATRAAADGNELLRFHSAPLACALGLRGSTSLCPGASASAADPCGVCSAIRHGFAPLLGAHPLGIRTTASSGRAHDCGGGARRAMLVCRVIAGRVRRGSDAGAGAGAEDQPFDSVAAAADAAACGGALEELFVANPRAILPCFVVVYRVQD